MSHLSVDLLDYFEAYFSCLSVCLELFLLALEIIFLDQRVYSEPPRGSQEEQISPGLQRISRLIKASSTAGPTSLGYLEKYNQLLTSEDTSIL